jgi:hypothetical protein
VASEIHDLSVFGNVSFPDLFITRTVVPRYNFGGNNAMAMETEEFLVLAPVANLIVVLRDWGRHVVEFDRMREGSLDTDMLDSPCGANDSGRGQQSRPSFGKFSESFLGVREAIWIIKCLNAALLDRPGIRASQVF